MVVNDSLRTWHNFFSLLLCVGNSVNATAHTSGVSAKEFAWFGLRGRRHCHRLVGNCPENYGSGLLNRFQALAQELGVSVPQRDVVGKGAAGIEANGLA